MGKVESNGAQIEGELFTYQCKNGHEFRLVRLSDGPSSDIASCFMCRKEKLGSNIPVEIVAIKHV